MEVQVNDRYKVRSDGTMNWLPYRRGESGSWTHMGTYHGTLQGALVWLHRHESIEDGRTMGSIKEAVAALGEFEREIVAAVRKPEEGR